MTPEVPTAIDEMVAKIDGATFADLLKSDPGINVLMRYATSMFESFHPGVQAYTSAIMMGMLWASMEGEMVEFEREKGQLIGIEDRLKVWAAVARVTYREAMQARMTDHPDNPDNPDRGQP